MTKIKGCSIGPLVQTGLSKDNLKAILALNESFIKLVSLVEILGAVKIPKMNNVIGINVSGEER